MAFLGIVHTASPNTTQIVFLRLPQITFDDIVLNLTTPYAVHKQHNACDLWSFSCLQNLLNFQDLRSYCGDRIA